MIKMTSVLWMPVVATALALFPHTAQANDSAECEACVATDCVQACYDEGQIEYDACCENEGGEVEICEEICGDDQTSWELDCRSGNMRGFDDCLVAGAAAADGNIDDDCCTSCTDDLAECSVSVDSDGDGVDDDLDLCADSASGDTVDADGCSIADHCPCDDDWKNHGDYVSCVSETTEAFEDAGLIVDGDSSDAGKSDCGKKTSGAKGKKK